MNLNDCELRAQELPVNDQAYEDRITSNTLYTWLDGSTTVAKVSIEKWLSGWTGMNSLEVFLPYRGKGLSHQVIEFAKDRGANNLSVDPGNSIAIRLYKEHGFIFTGETEGEFLRMRLSKKGGIPEMEHSATEDDEE